MKHARQDSLVVMQAGWDWSTGVSIKKAEWLIHMPGSRVEEKGFAENLGLGWSSRNMEDLARGRGEQKREYGQRCGVENDCGLIGTSTLICMAAGRSLPRVLDDRQTLYQAQELTHYPPGQLSPRWECMCTQPGGTHRLIPRGREKILDSSICNIYIYLIFKPYLNVF